MTSSCRTHQMQRYSTQKMDGISSRRYSTAESAVADLKCGANLPVARPIPAQCTIASACVEVSCGGVGGECRLASARESLHRDPQARVLPFLGPIPPCCDRNTGATRYRRAERSVRIDD